MSKSIAALCFCLATTTVSVYAANAQTPQWAWVEGSSTPNQPGVYGTVNTSAPENIPGARSNAGTWSDTSGNLWLYGGNGFDSAAQVGPLGDLWELDPLTSQWTWINGSSTLTCATQCGVAAVYGTLGTPANGNTPGNRVSPATWIDTSGNLWRFGGTSFTTADGSGDFSDLWKFNPLTHQWTWVNGSNTPGHPGSYGVLGTPAASNVPGSRHATITWTFPA